MTDPPHPDPIEQLRYALWGAVDDATAEVERHVSVERCAACGDEIDTYRRIRGVLSEARSAVPSEQALARVRDAVSEEAGVGASIEWLKAEPVLMHAGYRAGPDDDVQTVCISRNFHLDAVLHKADGPGFYAMTGQVLDQESDPVVGASVTLFVDLRPRDSTQTDVFGEFAFDAHRGQRFGVRVGTDAAAHHVEIWDEEARE